MSKPTRTLVVPQEAFDELRTALYECEMQNTEDGHYDADAAIVAFLRSLGDKECSELADAYEKLPKWFA